MRSGLQDAHVRPIVTRGFGAPGLDPARCERPSLVVAAYPFPPLLGSDPISVIISSVVRKAPRSVGAHVKSLNYIDAVLAKRQANAAGMQATPSCSTTSARSPSARRANLFAVIGGDARDADDALGAAGHHPANDPRGRRRARHPGRGARPLADGALHRPTRLFATGSGAGIVLIDRVDGNRARDRRQPDRRRRSRRATGRGRATRATSSRSRSGWRRDGRPVRRRSSSAAASSARPPPAGARARGHRRAPARGGPVRRASRRASRPRSSAATTRTPRSCGWRCTRARPSGGCRCCLECDPVYTQSGWLFLVDEENALLARRERRDAGRGGSRHASRSRTSRSTPRGRRDGNRLRALRARRRLRRRRRGDERLHRRPAPAGGAAREGTPVERIEVEGDRVRGVHVGGRAARVRQPSSSPPGPGRCAGAPASGSSCRWRSPASRT